MKMAQFVLKFQIKIRMAALLQNQKILKSSVLIKMKSIILIGHLVKKSSSSWERKLYQIWKRFLKECQKI